MARRRRPGFTAFDLIVLLALIGLALGMLLPYAQQLREIAARGRSLDNLKNLALAVHGFHDVQGRMPSGADPQGFSPHAHLLPYLEQDGLYKALDFAQPARAKANADAARTPVRAFLSPLDPLAIDKDRTGATNYLFNAGSKTPLKNNDGLFFADSKLRLIAITDGLSYTLMIGETLIGDASKKAPDVRRQHIALDEQALDNLKEDAGPEDFKAGKNVAADRGGRWIEGKFLQTLFTGTRKLNDDRPDVDGGGQGGLSALRSLSGPVPVAFADGNVRVLAPGISQDVLRRLCSRNDGQEPPKLD